MVFLLCFKANYVEMYRSTTPLLSMFFLKSQGTKDSLKNAV